MVFIVITFLNVSFFTNNITFLNTIVFVRCNGQEQYRDEVKLQARLVAAEWNCWILTKLLNNRIL